MKRLVLTLFLLQTTIFAGGDWLFINSPTNQNLTRISFIDSLYGWVSGDSGSFYHTSNGGGSWNAVNIGTRLNIQDHFFIDKKNGWAVTQEFDTITFIGSSKLYQTRDSGNTWQVYPFNDEDLFVTKIFFFDSLNGLAGGGRGELFYTENGGEKWFSATYDSNSSSGFEIINFNFYNDKFGYAMGGQMDAAGTVYRTINGGRSWFGGIIMADPIFSIKLYDSLSAIGFAGGFDEGTFIMRTSDAGNSWLIDTVNFFGIPEAFAQRTDKEMWLSLGAEGKFMYTEDNFNTFNVIYTPDSIKINDLSFPDSLNGFAVATHFDNALPEGKLLKFKYKEPTTVNESHPEKVSAFSVSCYPNPFNPSTTIEYTISVRSVVTIKLFDILGRDAGVLFHGEQQPGVYKYPVSAANLSAGVYICSITTNKEASFIKLLYLK